MRHGRVGHYYCGEIQPAHIRQIYVRDDQVGMGIEQLAPGDRCVFCESDGVAGVPQVEPEQVAHRTVIFDHENIPPRGVTRLTRDPARMLFLHSQQHPSMSPTARCKSGSIRVLLPAKSVHWELSCSSGHYGRVKETPHRATPWPESPLRPVAGHWSG